MMNVVGHAERHETDSSAEMVAEAARVAEADGRVPRVGQTGRRKASGRLEATVQSAVSAVKARGARRTGRATSAADVARSVTDATPAAGGPGSARDVQTSVGGVPSGRSVGSAPRVGSVPAPRQAEAARTSEGGDPTQVQGAATAATHVGPAAAGVRAATEAAVTASESDTGTESDSAIESDTGTAIETHVVAMRVGATPARVRAASGSVGRMRASAARSQAVAVVAADRDRGLRGDAGAVPNVERAAQALKAATTARAVTVVTLETDVSDEAGSATTTLHAVSSSRVASSRHRNHRWTRTSPARRSRASRDATCAR